MEKSFNWWQEGFLSFCQSIQSLRGVALLTRCPSRAGTASCTGWVEAKELLAWGNHHPWFLLSPGTKQTNSSEEDAGHSLAFLHSLQRAIFATCCSHTRPEHRATKAKPWPGLDSNPGKGTLALWTQTRLQRQPSSTQMQWFESSAPKKMLYTC